MILSGSNSWPFLIVFFTFVPVFVDQNGSPAVAQAPSQAKSPSPIETSESPSDQISKQFNLTYSQTGGVSLKCDVYLPGDQADLSTSEKVHPAVVVVHGGGWVSGDKWTTGAYCTLLAQNDFVVVNINYRLAPQNKFPAPVDDVRAALLWTKDHAKEYHIDIDRIGLFGYSAGGHLSALVSVLADQPMQTQLMASDWKKDDPRWKQLPEIKAVCLGGPPCDFRFLSSDNQSMSFFLGGTPAERPEVYLAASPTAHASSQDPPIQIIHGESDLMVPLASSQKFQTALQDHQVECRLKIIPNQGHVITFLHPETKSIMLDWFNEKL